MEKKENFKKFVRNNPILLKFVQNGSMTWQKFYEMYDMYGEDDSVWNTYFNSDVSSSVSSLGLFDFIKNLDMDSIQSGINSIQRVVSLLQEMTNKNSNNSDRKDEYKPRPVYKHFED